VRTSDALATALPVHGDLGEVAGALVVPLPDGDALALFRRAVAQEVTWGGNPDEKPLTIDNDGVGHLGPHRSFSKWQQVVRSTSRPWSPEDVGGGRRGAPPRRRDALPPHPPDLGAALALQRSSLPQRLPQPDGWQVSARYRPADGGKVGGDWYDSFQLASGHVALVVGDVAGHGLGAASSMNHHHAAGHRPAIAPHLPGTCGAAT